MLSACQEKIDVSNTEGYDLFITQLKEGLKNTSHETAANHKVAKVSMLVIRWKRCFYFIVTSCNKQRCTGLQPIVRRISRLLIL